MCVCVCVNGSSFSEGQHLVCLLKSFREDSLRLTCQDTGLPGNKEKEKWGWGKGGHYLNRKLMGLEANHEYFHFVLNIFCKTHFKAVVLLIALIR